MLHAGTDEDWPLDPLALKLDRAYYALTRTTSLHFGEEHEGWFATGVEGLDAPTMNRAVVEHVGDGGVQGVIDGAERFFGARVATWSVVLSTFRPARKWHSELIMRGLSPTTSLDVLARAPGELPGPEPDVRVREARVDELPLFTDILIDVFRMPRRFYPALLAMTQAWVEAGSRAYFGLDEEGAPVSTTLLSRVGDVAGIYNVGTLRSARRRGHARALMARAMRDAKDASVVTLQVAPDGFVEGFYLGLGFEPVYSWRFYMPRSRLGFFGR